jgi:membrane protein DedA with SNARE-associated domain
MVLAPAQVTQVPPFLQDLFTSDLAYVVLLGVFVLEGAMLMYFMPSEAIVPSAVLLIGGSLAANAAIIVTAVIGATVGQYVLFVLAKRGGREYLLEKRWFRVKESHLDRFDGWFDRWGPVVVPVANSLPFTRGMLTVPAGFAKMGNRQFIALSALGTLVFESILAVLAVGLLGFL